MSNTMRKNVVKLRQQGYKVKYRTRKDGGILITSINGRKFKSAQGNAYARSLLGERLSSARSYQLSRLNPYVIMGSGKNKVRAYRVGMEGRKRPALKDIANGLPKILKDELKKVQQMWRKGAGVLKTGHSTIKGTITISNLRYQYETYGLDIAMEKLAKARRYAEGYAYEENIDWFKDELKDLLKDADFDWSGVEELIELLNTDEVRANFEEEWLLSLHEELYKVTKAKGSITQSAIDEMVIHMKRTITGN